MKSNDKPVAPKTTQDFGLVANGSAGRWAIDVDETLEGPHQWFAQIEGPSCDIYFRIPNPEVVESMRGFLRSHLCPDHCADKLPDKPGQRGQLELGRDAGTVVSLIWDTESNDRCYLVVNGKGAFHARFCIERSDLTDIVHALDQVREDLSESGLLSQSSI